MAYDKHSEYPRIIASGDISTSVDVGTNGVELLVAFIRVANTTGASATLTLTGHGGTTTEIDYTVDLPDESERVFGPFKSTDGLRLASAAALQYIVGVWDGDNG